MAGGVVNVSDHEKIRSASSGCRGFRNSVYGPANPPLEHDPTSFSGREIATAELNPMRSGGRCDIGPGIDEHRCLRWPRQGEYSQCGGREACCCGRPIADMQG